MKLTTDQRNAIHTHDRNLAVVAGAGSGKTFVLVERYLKLLEANPTWPLNALVAITFTRKAAQEMRDRVRHELSRRAAGESNAHRWSDLLVAMDSARIETIHSLCTTILRANAAEAGLDPRFAVMDEIQSGILLNDVIDSVLAGLGEQPAAELFAHYDAHEIRNVLRATVYQPLEPLPEDIVSAWRKTYTADVAGFILLMRANHVYRDADVYLGSLLLPRKDKLTPIVEATLNALKALMTHKKGRPIDPVLDAVQALTEIKLNVGAAKAWGGKDELAELKACLRQTREQAKLDAELLGKPPGDIDIAAARFMPAWHDLLSQVQHAFTAAKRRGVLLDFDDLEYETAKLLSEHDHVRRRYVGAEFKHVLVDEFQDTNERQWAIIEALTAPDEPLNGAARLFVVGDPKQSIYGFRGADVRVFDNVRTKLSRTAPEIDLVRSFRTHSSLVGCFNDVFDQLLYRDPSSPVAGYEVEYGKPMEAAREHPPGEPPVVEVLVIDKQSGDDIINVADARQWEAREIAVRLRDSVGVLPVHDKPTEEHRPLRFDDVVLLFQSMSNVGVYEEALRECGVPYTTVAGKGYYSRQEVWDLLALLEALYNPADDLALATVLRSPMFSLSDDTLLALRLHEFRREPIPLWRALERVGTSRDTTVEMPEDERGAVSQAYKVLDELSALAGRVTISALLREALARTGYLATLNALPDGARRRANIEKLLDKALQSGKTGLGDFSAYLSDLSEREVRESEATTDMSGSVTLMTVHASKGLEFPVVVLVDTAWERGKSVGKPHLLYEPGYGIACAIRGEDLSWQKPYVYDQIVHRQVLRDAAEQKRRLYVAATRARDYLFIGGNATWDYKSEKWTAKGWLKMLLPALRLDNVRAEDQVFTYAWGKLRLRCPVVLPDGKRALDDPLPPTWESNRVLAGEPLTEYPVAMPPLLAAVPLEPGEFARDLTATQIADAGSAASKRDAYGQRFRRSVLYDAPARLPRVVHTPNSTPRVPPAKLGNIVHQALRYWRFPTREDPMEAVLRSYAWEEGIVDPDDLSYAVKTAGGWLKDMRFTDIYRWVNKSTRVYRELPFVYRTSRRVIHGVIDILFQREDGVWVIADYKSGAVKGVLEYGMASESAERENNRLIDEHAEKYHLQVGVYAAAVERYLTALDEPPVGDNLDVYIHYIRYGRTVRVLREAWEAALARLEARIGKLID